MEHRRHITITDDYPKRTGINAAGDLGRFLMLPQVVDVVSGFKASVSKMPGNKDIEVIPPLHPSRLDELGKKLVELAQTIDGSAPIDYRINKIPSNMAVMDKRHFTGKYDQRLNDEDFPKD